MSDFQGIQGGGNSAYENKFTWGGAGARIKVDTTVHRNELYGGPNGMSLKDAAMQGYYQVPDAYDGAWLWVKAGEMVPLTQEVRAAKDAERVASRIELRALRSQAVALLNELDRALK